MISLHVSSIVDSGFVRCKLPLQLCLKLKEIYAGVLLFLFNFGVVNNMPSFIGPFTCWLPSLKLTWPMNITIFPGKYHQNGGFSMAILVYRSVIQHQHLFHSCVIFGAFGSLWTTLVNRFLKDLKDGPFWTAQNRWIFFWWQTANEAR